MASNYEKIAEQNVEGWKNQVGVFGDYFAEELYSKSAHFILELLQNAEDALSRRRNEGILEFKNKGVEFNLFNDRLEFRHFGSLFTIDDVISITNFLQGTKKGNNSQIGRFGIGFKSVYIYTNSPEIYSGDEHFRIEEYIHPVNIPSRDLRDGETLFIFPFNKPKLPPEQAFLEIQNRLVDLGARTLLFLNDIESIEWSINGVKKGIYLRQSIVNNDGSLVINLLGQHEENSIEEKWLVYKKAVKEIDSPVEIAYLLGEDKNHREYIKPIERANLFAYFETARETGLSFLIQGHYHPTSSRDNIQERHPVNIQLINETCKLFTDSLVLIREKGLLDAQLLEAMPINNEHFEEGSLFFPFYESFLNAIRIERLLPTNNNNYSNSHGVKLARGAGLIQLIDSKSLQELFFEEESIDWLSSDITEIKTPNFRRYLLNVIGVDEINPERFARLITEDFLSGRTDKWFIKFYEFLLTNPSLWKKRERRWEEEGVLRNKPIIRLENDNLVKPYDYSPVPTVYLPPDYETDFPIVKRAIAKDTNAIKFLINLGLQTPDIVDEVVTRILSLYPSRHTNDNPVEISIQDHQIHIKKIGEALNSATGEKKKWLLNELQSTRLLRAINQGSALRDYKSPIQIYIDNKELRDYFEGNPDIYFYDPIYSSDLNLLEDIGVSRLIRMKNRNEKCDYVELPWENKHRRGINGFNPKWEVDGLTFAVKNPNIVRSKIIWETILRPNKHLIYGAVESCTRQTYTGSTKIEELSIAGRIVRQGRWLPDKDGFFHIPSELSLDDLPKDFFRDEELSDQLGMKGISSSAFAHERKIDESLLTLGIAVMQSAPDLFKEFALRILKKQTEILPSKEFSYLPELEETFSHSEYEDVEEEFNEIPHPDIQNPERRRELTQEEILAAIASESNKDLRFKIIPLRIANEKDKSIRGFLYEQYQGKCQICSDTFKKRTGRFYFEGLYLVSRLNAQWVDRPGNVLCLCANCCAKFQHGPLRIENLKEQILNIKMKSEGGTGHPGIIIDLCGETLEIKYTERHILDLQEIIKVSKLQLEE